MMRLRLRLPETGTEPTTRPDRCTQAGCSGHYFSDHQQCEKRLSDLDHDVVQVKRYKCVRCGHTFRVYPSGVSRAQRSDRLRGFGVLLYVLGLSYGGVADALAALGLAGSKSSIYRDVQAAGEGVRRIRRSQGSRKVQVMSADATYVICNRSEVTIAVALDALAGDVLEIELVDSESAANLRPFLEEMKELFQVEVLLSDDHDSYKRVADDLGLKHAVCRRHINQNVAKLVAELGEAALKWKGPPPPGVGRSIEEFLTDLEYVQLVVALRPPDGAQQLWDLLRCYQAAPPPAEGEKATLWYRFRLALLRWCNNWPRITFDQRWNQEHTAKLDGTNNVAERAIGWQIKDRYRTMRTYKRPQSVRNVTNLIICLAANPQSDVMSQLLAA
ncbi:MAG: hypothetical protein D6790_11660 [Caldilineae bacterium]|nr:MAG: hypothetical protein D6790_11660 [Caldilineae bacterium]